MPLVHAERETISLMMPLRSGVACDEPGAFQASGAQVTDADVLLRLVRRLAVPEAGHSSALLSARSP